MTEVLFRGKRLLDYKIIYGDVRYINDEVFIYPRKKQTEIDHYQIDSKTIDQYTNIDDINSNKIFVNDIVKNINPESDAYNETALVEYHKSIGGYVVMFETIGQYKMLGMYDKLEKIGDIYNNSDLL